MDSNHKKNIHGPDGDSTARFTHGVSFASLGVLLTACGGGGGDANVGGQSIAPINSESANDIHLEAELNMVDSNPDEGYVNQTSVPIKPRSLAEASLFLAHAGFGACAREVVQVRALDYQTWLQQEMAKPARRTRLAWLIDKGYNIETANVWDVVPPRMIWEFLGTAQQDGQLLRRKMGYVWSNVFVVSGIKSGGLSARHVAIGSWADMLDRMAFANFRALLKEVTLHPFMGHYLDMVHSVRADPTRNRVPDENFAREVMQLFTLGLIALNDDGTPKRDHQGAPIEIYSNTDLQGLASALSGWGYDRSRDLTGWTADRWLSAMQLPMVPKTGLHETAEKKFLGRVIQSGTQHEASLEIVLDVLFEHDNLPPFICKKLIQLMVSSNPSPTYVARVVTVFKNNGSGVRGDIAAVVQAILLDAEARLPSKKNVYSGKLRDPVSRLLHWCQFARVTTFQGDWFGYTMDQLEQMPFYAPSVFNFFSAESALPSNYAGSGLVAPEFDIAVGQAPSNYIRMLESCIGSGLQGRLLSKYDDWLSYAADPPLLVNLLNQVVACGAIPDADVMKIRIALEAHKGTPESSPKSIVRLALFLVMTNVGYIVHS